MSKFDTPPVQERPVLLGHHTWKYWEWFLNRQSHCTCIFHRYWDIFLKQIRLLFFKIGNSSVRPARKQVKVYLLQMEVVHIVCRQLMKAFDKLELIFDKSRQWSHDLHITTYFPQYTGNFVFSQSPFHLVAGWYSQVLLKPIIFRPFLAWTGNVMSEI